MSAEQQQLAPLSYRFGKALPWLIAGFGSIAAMVWLMSLEGTLVSHWYYFALPAVPSVVGILKLLRPISLPVPASPAPPPLPSSPSTGDTRDPLFDAKWWIRYHVSLIFFAGAYYCAFVWEHRFGWVFALLVLVGGLGLIRELFLAVVAAILVAAMLWAVGAAVAALPVSAAIIIGAMIIAQALRR